MKSSSGEKVVNNHENSSDGSQNLCEELFFALSKRIDNLKKKKTKKWCCIFQEGGNQFAYFSHQRRGSAITIWCRGSLEEMSVVNDNSIITIKSRSGQGKGNWAKDFTNNFTISTASQIFTAAEILADVSFKSLGTLKHKTIQQDGKTQLQSFLKYPNITKFLFGEKL